MKHKKIIENIFSKLHEKWMSEIDKSEFDEDMIRQFGEQLEKDIDTGIANGLTAEQQESIFLSLLKEMK